MESQVPLMLASPNVEAKIPTFEPQNTIKIRLIISKIGSRLFYAKYMRGACVETQVLLFA